MLTSPLFEDFIKIKNFCLLNKTTRSQQKNKGKKNNIYDTKKKQMGQLTFELVYIVNKNKEIFNKINYY